MTILTLVQPEKKYYLVTLKEGGVVRVQAKSYSDTAYGTFAFYREDIELVNRSYNKGSPLVPIYELSRKFIASVEEEGMAEVHPVVVKRKTPKQPKKARVSTVKKLKK